MISQYQTIKAFLSFTTRPLLWASLLGVCFFASFTNQAQAGAPDLIVVDLTREGLFEVGNTLTISWEVLNTGPEDTLTGFTSRFCLDSAERPHCMGNESGVLSGEMLSELETGPLAAGAFEKKIVNWVATTPGTHTIFLCADVTAVIDEEDEFLGNEDVDGNCAKTTFEISPSSTVDDACTLVQGSGVGEYDYVYDFQPNFIFDGPPTQYLNGPVNIPAGTYEITLESYDGGDERSPTSDGETPEIWSARMFDVNETLYVTGWTEDLPDGDFVKNTTVVETSMIFSDTVDELWAQTPDGGKGLTAVCAGFDSVITNTCTLDPGEFDYVIDFTTSDTSSSPGALRSNGNFDDGVGGLEDAVTDIVTLNLSSGIYKIELQSFDGYEGRGPGDAQLEEEWKLEFMEGETGVVTSNPIDDLIDTLDYVNSSVVVNNNDLFVYSDDIDGVRAVHSAWLDPGPNGVTAVCAGIKNMGPTDACTLDPDVPDRLLYKDWTFDKSAPAAYPIKPIVPNIPVGSYKVTVETFDWGWDRDVNPSDLSQVNESLRIVLRDGNVPNNDISTDIAVSGQTDDLPDAVSAKLVTVVNDASPHVNGPLIVPSSASYLIAGRPAYPGNGGHSVIPACVAFDPLEQANLTPLISSIIPSTDIDPNAFNPATGAYDYVSLSFSIQNNGGIDAGKSTTTITIDIGNDGSIESTINTTLAGLTGNTDTPLQSVQLATNVPPGDFKIVVTVDSTDDVFESDETDNTIEILGSVLNPPGPDIYLPPLLPPDPGVELNINPGFVRYGESTQMDWNTNATYLMDCEIWGKGKLLREFDPSDTLGDLNTDGDNNPATGIWPTGAITSKSEFLLKCIERISGTNQVFSDTAIVETPGKVEEL